MFKNIFIVGTGRSGTHFLCRSLRGFSNVDDYQNGKENHDIRIPLTEMALKHQPLSSDIIDYYTSSIEEAEHDGKIFLDQLHTNLYHVDQLAKHFPNSLFLATQRPKEQIVASMLNHGGVRKWFKYAMKHDDVVFPNKFLGVNSREEIQRTDEHVLCAKRVDAHNNETMRILKKYPTNVRTVDFTKLVLGQEQYFKTLFSETELQRLGKYTNIETPNRNALFKYKNTLNANKLKEIK